MNFRWASRVKVLDLRRGGFRERTSGVGHHSMPRPHRLSASFSRFQPGVPERGPEACDTPPQGATGDEKKSNKSLSLSLSLSLSIYLYICVYMFFILGNHLRRPFWILIFSQKHDCMAVGYNRRNDINLSNLKPGHTSGGSGRRGARRRGGAGRGRADQGADGSVGP